MNKSSSSLQHSYEVSDHGDETFQSRYSSDLFHEAPEDVIYFEGDIKILKTIELNKDGMCCRFSKTADRLAVGLSNGDIKIYKSSGECIYHLADEDTKSDRLPVTSLNFIPPELSSRGELLIATYASGLIKYWHISTGTSLHTYREQRELLTGALDPTYSYLAVGGTANENYVFELATGKKLNVYGASPDRLVMDGHRSRILAIKYHPLQSNIFLSGGWDDTVQIWDQRDSHSLRRFFGPHICGEGIDIDEKNDQILTSSWRKHEVLQIWDFKSGKKLKTVPNDFSYNSLLYCGQWLGQDRMLCGGSDNNMVRIVDRTTLATSGMVCNLPSGIYSVDHDRQRLLHQKPHSGDVTLIIAVAGKHLYFISNAIQPKKDEKQL